MLLIKCLGVEFLVAFGQWNVCSSVICAVLIATEVKASGPKVKILELSVDEYGIVTV